VITTYDNSSKQDDKKQGGKINVVENQQIQSASPTRNMIHIEQEERRKLLPRSSDKHSEHQKYINQPGKSDQGGNTNLCNCRKMG
jgi:hypothetical protein